MLFSFGKNGLVAKKSKQLSGIQRKKITRRTIKRTNEVCERKPRVMVWTFVCNLPQPPILKNGSHHILNTGECFLGTSHEVTDQ